MTSILNTSKPANKMSVVHPLNLNVATYEQLVAIKGIKDFSARMILAKRQEIRSGTPPRDMTLVDILELPTIRNATWERLLNQNIICFGPHLEIQVAICHLWLSNVAIVCVFY